jgi:hypothetical protein
VLSNARELRESAFNQVAVYCATVAALDRGLPVPPVPENRPASGEDPADQAWDLLESAALALAAGDRLRACADATRAAEMLHAFGGTSDDFVWTYGLAGSLAAEIGDTDRLTALLGLIDDPDRLAAGSRGHYLRILGLSLRASEPDRVEPLLREAAACFEQWGSPLWRARTMADLGVRLDRQGAEDQSAAALDKARSTYEELGAKGLLADLDQQLAAAR